jgi:xylan 1,4-beta-xylosidase
VCRWPFEVWNEPNLEAFGSGRQADYFALYRETVRAIKNVDPALRVGGPATAASAWIDDFLTLAQRSDLSIDFVSTHQYPTDAFGEPGDDTETQLSKSRYGVMRAHAQDVRRQCGGRPLYYTEWNTSSNPRDPLHDQPFAAAFAVNILMSVADVVDAYSWWTCSDIFNENYMPSVPYQGGFGLLNIHGVPKPVYRAFELLHRLGPSQLEVHGSQRTVSAWASRIDATHVSLLVTNHALPRHDVTTEQVHVVVRDVATPIRVTIERIDDDHANAPSAWRRLGAPEYPSLDQVEHLKSSSALVKESLPFTFDGQHLGLTFGLMPHAVAAITIECVPRLRARQHD